MPAYRTMGLPKLTGNNDTDIVNLRNIFYEQDEQLRYLFNHLDEGNFGNDFPALFKNSWKDETESTTIEIDKDGIIAEIKGDVSGDIKEISSKLQITAEEISATVNRVETIEGEYISDDYLSSALDGYVTETKLSSELSLTSEGILSTVSRTYATVDTVENIEKNYVSDETLAGILSEYVTDDDIDSVRISLETKINQNADAIALRATKEYVAESLNGYVTEAKLSAELKISSDGVLSTVSRDYATTGAVNTAQNTANAAGSAAATAQNTADSAKNTADAVAANLSNNYYAKSTIDQKFDGITLSVINPDGEETSISLTDGKLDLAGLVTFTNLSTQGETTINGSNITTGIINADLITAGTIKGIEYISRSASQPNDYLQIWNSGLTTRKIGSSDGYTTYTDIFLSPGKLSCQYGDIDQANYIADYSYDGIRLRAGDDASSETPMSIIASRSDNVSRLTVTSPNVDFTGSIGLPNGQWLTAKNSAGSTRSMVMLNSSDQYFFGYSGFTESEGASFFDGNIVHLRSNGAIYFTAYSGKGNGQILIGAQTSVSDRGLELKPATNNTCSLGWEDGRWKYAYIWKIYTTNSVSVDSDRRLKKDISYDLSALDKVIDNLNPAVYRMRDDEEEKLRFGFIAQDVQQAFTDAGLNPDNYAFITKSKTEDGETLSLGYTETNALLWHRQQQLEQRIAELESKIA